MRTPGRGDQYAASVSNIALDFGIYSYSGLRVRPAFDLDPQAVLFTTALERGKAISGETGSEALVGVGTNASDSWTVTLRDDGTIKGLDGHAGFRVETVTADADGIWAIRYSGALSGKNEYISIIVTDSTGTNIKYYGRIASASSEDSTIAYVNLLDKVGDGDKVYVFNKQYNGEGVTDLASGLIEISSIKVDKAWEEGNGTEQDPYIIANANDWIALQKYVKDGCKTEGVYWRLGADIEETDMVGTNANPFSGTFDGAKHTLTFNADDYQERTASFRYINGATIRNMHVAGSITGRFKQRASGLSAKTAVPVRSPTAVSV